MDSRPRFYWDMPQTSLAPPPLEGTVLSSELASSTMARLNQEHDYFGYPCLSSFIHVSVAGGKNCRLKLGDILIAC